MKIVSGSIGLVLIVLALCFALANRQAATISLWPFGVDLTAPLYLLSLGTLFLGLLAGALIAWLFMLPHRFTARRLRKDIALLRSKIEGLQQTVIEPIRKDSFFLSEPKSKRRFWGLKR